MNSVRMQLLVKRFEIDPKPTEQLMQLVGEGQGIMRPIDLGSFNEEYSPLLSNP